MKEFLKKMFWGSLYLCSVCTWAFGVMLGVNMILNPLGGVLAFLKSCSIVAADIVVSDCISQFSKKKYDEIEASPFVDNMEKFLKKMFKGSLCLTSALVAFAGVSLLVIVALNPLECITSLADLVSIGVTGFFSVRLGKVAYFSGKEFNEIDIQFVDKMKDLGKWIKTGVDKVLNLVPGLSRIVSVHNEQNIDNSIVTNQDDNRIEVEPGTQEVMSPVTNQNNGEISEELSMNRVMNIGRADVSNAVGLSVQ